jgi:4-diphosphocytidyl-2-C-methyl-D-erythritol kinase
MLKIATPAKLNLVLEILGKRKDGYHEIRSLIQTISLEDVLSFEPDDAVSLKSSDPALEIPDNLILRAAELMKKSYSIKTGAKINLEKKIPWSAGLGGGSSDAAATVLALNEIWGLHLGTMDLLNLAAQLGSDVPFFINGNAALVEGRGEKVTRLPSLRSPIWFILLLPSFEPMPDKTKRAYSLINSKHFTHGEFCSRAMKTWSEKNSFNPDLLFNIFDGIAFEIYPRLKLYWDSMEQTGAKNIHLAGSGPVLFAPVGSKIEGDRLCRNLEEQGFTCSTVSAKVKDIE